MGPAGLDHTHQQITDGGALFGSEEECVLAVQHDTLQRPLDGIGIQRCISSLEKLG
jgi:hypothetical protein